MIPRKVGADLRRRRLRLGMSQQELALQVGVSRAYIGNVENGADWEPKVEVLVRWAGALGMDPAELLRRVGRLAAGEPLVSPASAVLPAGVEDAIRRAAAEGVRAGVEEALREARGEAPAPAPEPRAARPPRPKT